MNRPTKRPSLNGEDLAKPASLLPVKALRDLGRMLHQPLHMSGTWEMVAEELGYGVQDIQQFATSASVQQERFPGEQMLQHWAAQGAGRTLFVLHTVLHNAGMHECVEYLEKEIYNGVVTMSLMVCIRHDDSNCTEHINVRTRSDSTILDSLRNDLAQPIDVCYRLLDSGVSWTGTLSRELKGRQLMLLKLSSSSPTEQDPTIGSSIDVLKIIRKPRSLNTSGSESFQSTSQASNVIFETTRFPYNDPMTFKPTVVSSQCPAPINTVVQVGNERSNSSENNSAINEEGSKTMATYYRSVTRTLPLPTQLVSTATSPGLRNGESSTYDCDSNKTLQNEPMQTWINRSDKCLDTDNIQGIQRVSTHGHWKSYSEISMCSSTKKGTLERNIYSGILSPIKRSSIGSKAESINKVSMNIPVSSMEHPNKTVTALAENSKEPQMDTEENNFNEASFTRTHFNDTQGEPYINKDKVENSRVMHNEVLSLSDNECEYVTYSDFTKAYKGKDNAVGSEYSDWECNSFADDMSAGIGDVTFLPSDVNFDIGIHVEKEDNEIDSDNCDATSDIDTSSITYLKSVAQKEIQDHANGLYQKRSESGFVNEGVIKKEERNDDNDYPSSDSSNFQFASSCNLNSLQSYHLQTIDDCGKTIPTHLESDRYPEINTNRNGCTNSTSMSELCGLRRNVPGRLNRKTKGFRNRNTMCGGYLGKAETKQSYEVLRRFQSCPTESVYIDSTTADVDTIADVFSIVASTTPANESLPVDSNSDTDSFDVFVPKRRTFPKATLDRSNDKVKRTRHTLSPSNQPRVSFDINTPSETERLPKSIAMESCDETGHTATFVAANACRNNSKTDSRDGDLAYLGKPSTLQNFPEFQNVSLNSRSSLSTGSEHSSDRGDNWRPRLPLRNSATLRPSFVEPARAVPAGRSSKSLDHLLKGDNLFDHYNTRLRSYPGWSPKETDFTVERTMSSVRQLDSYFILWYSRLKKNLIITVTSVGQILHTRVHTKIVEGDRLMYYVTKDKMFNHVIHLLEHVTMHGLRSHGENRRSGSRNSRFTVLLKRPVEVCYNSKTISV
ncbi:hypothetical protein MAR_011989 [Mya arenaria]|uniref:Death domain-containing protein n=1 Tax=Mya arenaria TaxID=6604 RepID=A0ABY7FVR9_MYAAR|nr:uncharacterized protein LOC128218575 [Mya arenaria]WAR26285.1 hypothetical protein MAR_011989 [Mya arenaria]